MTTTTATPTARSLRGRARLADRAFRWFVLGAGLLVLVVLALIALVMLGRTRDVFDVMGLRFFTERRWNPPQQIYGALAFIWGTIYTSAIAMALAVPVSLGIALFITQVAPRWLKMPMIYVIDLLAVVPSVVFGLWGALVLSRNLTGIYGWLSRTSDGVPVMSTLFGDNPQARSFLTAGIVLGIMITPIATSLSREVIETTPPGEKEAALALGATRWEMIRGAVIPHSKGGLVGSVMLGLGRALGETVAVALTVGAALGVVNLNLLSSGNTMPSVIVLEWGEADSLKKSALIAMAVTLFVITIIVNMTASAIVQRSLAKSQGLR